MGSLTIHALADAALTALQVLAFENRSTPEAEARRLLEAALCPKGRLCVGSALSGMSKSSGLSNEDVEALEAVREANPSPPTWFG